MISDYDPFGLGAAYGEAGEWVAGPPVPSRPRTQEDLHGPMLCNHYETGTQPGECEDCVCEDCGAWRPSKEISQCGGLCRKCLDASRSQVDAGG